MLALPNKTQFEPSREKNIVNSTSVMRFIMLLLLMLVPAGLSYFIAKDKGRNVGLWTVLGLIPFLNWMCLLYFVSATNLRLEGKLDKVIARLDAQG